MDTMVFALPEGFRKRLFYISSETGISYDELVQMALENCYIMYPDEIEQPLPCIALISWQNWQNLI